MFATVETTLRHWGISVDETFFLGGIEKTSILKEFAPHIFFDDQRLHLDAASGLVPTVHVPFGEANQSDTPSQSEPGKSRVRRKK
jgi:5'-nucleotidase